MAPVSDEATIEAEVARRVAALPPVDNSALIEAEVARKLAEKQANQPPQLSTEPIDHTAAIEAEVARRIADFQAGQAVQSTEPPQPVDNSAAIEAEVAKRIAQAQIIANSAAVEAEVSRRLAESQASHGSEPGEVTPSAADVEKIVEDRVKKEKEKLEQRITEARKGFQEYKAKAVAKALSDAAVEFEKKIAAKDEEHKKQIQALEATIAQLKNAIEELKRQLEEVKATQPTIPQINVEQHQKALDAKDLEHQKEVQKIKEEEESKLEQAKVDIRHEVQAELLVVKGGETDTTDPSAKKPPTQEELKAIIKRNVEHRLGKEKEKWQREIDNEQEKTIESKLQGALEGKLKEMEAELQIQQAASLEKSKDALRQEGAARIKVQLSMMEKRNKTLEEKIKAYESLGGSPPQQVAPPATGVKPPGAVIHPTPQQGETSQIPLPRGQGPPRKADGQGTGPAALRSLRGVLESNIPRGGGRGGGQGGRGVGGQPQQQQQQPLPGMQQSPGASQPYPQPAFQTSQMGQIGQMGQMSPNQQQQQGLPQPAFGHRLSLPGQGQQPQPQPQLPRPGIFSGGRGAGGPFNPGPGRGRGAAPQLQNIQTGHPQQNATPSQQSPGRGMNPGARQFVPTKRLREDGTEAEDQNSNIGKRIRGGHTG
ncbi:hypothetical protein B9Z19DRAFT_531136 [Tuber borchii]|uniref:Uncharacterized protein n=1 Tax=Tuber borchii TaxID=42251 RepID=A0A2T6ZDR3_TUBBO|nr:hypothetical protein B9Z19DRAFT_531136 [Tuber borchii]